MVISIPWARHVCPALFEAYLSASDYSGTTTMRTKGIGMNGAQLHLLVNHLPIFATFFALPALIWVLFKRRDACVMIIAVIILAVAGAGAIVSHATGEGAEKVVEELPGIEQTLVKKHEAKADSARNQALFTALMALVLLAYLRRNRTKVVPLWTALVLLIATLTSAALMGSAGYSGGLIRHREMQGNPVVESVQVEGTGSTGIPDTGGDE